MTEESIVAVYDTSAHAEAAIADLLAAKVPESAISQHAGPQGTDTGIASPVREQGFWASLFGGEADHDTSVYDRSMESGSSVVVVKAPAHDVDAVMAILERHHPIDIDERATGYGLSSTATTGAAISAASLTNRPILDTTTSSASPMSNLASDEVGVDAGAAPQPVGQGDTIQLAEESLAVGKRLVNRGGTRIRRYVVETPVEESVSLHSEKVTLERRPVTDGRALQDANFSDKTIEMLETTEEAVVSKTAHVYEEVGLRKEATDRVETVRDTVRKEEVEVEQIPGTTTTTTSGTTLDAAAPKT